MSPGRFYSLCLLLSLILSSCSGEEALDPITLSYQDQPSIPALYADDSDGQIQPYSSSGPVIVYLNFDGAVITKSSLSDATTNKFLYGGTIPPFKGTANDKKQIVDRLNVIYQDFNILTVQSRPSTPPYHMQVIGGTPSALGVSSDYSGIGSLNCKNARTNMISFSFAEKIYQMFPTQYVLAIGENMAHELGHSLGLEDQMDDKCELMYYLKDPSVCGFAKMIIKNENNRLQYPTLGNCDGSGVTNSYLRLQANVGLKEKEKPKVSISSPANGATVAGPNVTVVATATDNQGVAKVEILVDSLLKKTLNTAPYTFILTLSNGSHAISVQAYDDANNKGTASISVTVINSKPQQLDSGSPPHSSKDLTLPSPDKSTHDAQNNTNNQTTFTAQGGCSVFSSPKKTDSLTSLMILFMLFGIFVAKQKFHSP